MLLISKEKSSDETYSECELDSRQCLDALNVLRKLFLVG